MLDDGNRYITSQDDDEGDVEVQNVFFFRNDLPGQIYEIRCPGEYQLARIQTESQFNSTNFSFV